ncbi:MAG: sugar ABC transporter permease [Clostridia bacterium]|nr:sugar ABC transporter permease [Clostridia bacterium]
MKKQTSIGTLPKKNTLGVRIGKEWRENYELYIMFLPALVYYLIFSYKPMYGALMAFQNYAPAKGIWGSDWVGFKHFIDFFKSYYFVRVIRNTVTISVNSILFGFTTPIILALLINELQNMKMKRLVQTVSYLPHFISTVVICGMIKKFTLDTGIINDIIALFGGERVTFLNKPEYFVPVYIISDIWQGVGWGSIIYLAALSGISQELYEAAMIDGAGRWRQTIHVTIPGILPTIITMLILRMGRILSVGYEKIILLYNPMTMETADIISSFVYRKGLQEQNLSFSTAVGLFNSAINLTLLMITNKISKKVNDTALW